MIREAQASTFEKARCGICRCRAHSRKRILVSVGFEAHAGWPSGVGVCRPESGKVQRNSRAADRGGLVRRMLSSDRATAQQQPERRRKVEEGAGEADGGGRTRDWERTEDVRRMYIHVSCPVHTGRMCIPTCRAVHPVFHTGHTPYSTFAHIAHIAHHPSVVSSDRANQSHVGSFRMSRRARWDCRLSVLIMRWTEDTPWLQQPDPSTMADGSRDNLPTGERGQRLAVDNRRDQLDRPSSSPRPRSSFRPFLTIFWGQPPVCLILLQ